MSYVLLIIWYAYWSAESGSSLPWSRHWQGYADWFSEVPEAVIALTTGVIATLGWGAILGLPVWVSVLVFVVSVGIVYGGKQAATFALLIWNTHVPRNPNRKSTWRKLNDWVGERLGFKFGDEGYAWVWAATKGLLMTLPVGGLGLILNPIGHEVGSHAKGRLPGDPNMWKELTSGGIGLGIPAAIFIGVIMLLI